MVLGFKNQGKIGISLGKALKRAQGSLEKKKELIVKKHSLKDVFRKLRSLRMQLSVPSSIC